MLRAGNRVKETTETAGTGTLDLGGAVEGFVTFVAGIGDGNQAPYLITDDVAWEVGLGTVTAGLPDTLSRDTILDSSNGGQAVNWSAGTKQVLVTMPSVQSDMLQDLLDGRSWQVLTQAGSIATGGRYFLAATATFTLDDPAALADGLSVIVFAPADFSATINVAGGSNIRISQGGEIIQDTAVIVSGLMAEFVTRNGQWEV